MLVLTFYTVRGDSATGLCTYFASPTGQGDGRTGAHPFDVGDFWGIAKPGDTLCLTNGVYRGKGAMIAPPRGLSGRSDRPITVRALSDGKVFVDGEGKNSPIRLVYSDWFVIEGVDACCSAGTVVGLDHSNRNVIRRVAAWDAADGNHSIFGVHYGEHNLLEDVAGWGIARKIFESSQRGNVTTIRRAWGRWEGSHVVGPKMVYTLAYNNYDMIVENSIGTWSGEKMKKSYVLLDYYGKPWAGRGEGLYDDYQVNQPLAVFGMDGMDKDKTARTKLLGSIAYVRAGDAFKAPYLVFITKLNSVEIADTLAYVEPGAYSEVKTFGLHGFNLRDVLKGLTGPSTSVLARNLTSLGGAGAVIQKDWDTRNLLEGSSPSAYGATKSAFQTTRGANLCRRYVDGILTGQPLWPWPMNQRILDAMIRSGRRPVDVTDTIESFLGPIPSPCRSPAERPGATGPPNPPRP